MNRGPIGVFDSGVGGLSVLAELRKHLPHEVLLYVADSAHVPYGAKKADEIRSRSLALARFLLGQRAKALVVACNTATAAAAALLRETFAAPVVAVSPITGGRAVKGPTAKMMVELGLPVSATAVARRYRDLLDAYVLDRADAGAVADTAELGIAVSVAHTLMTTLEEREALARHVLATADALAEAPA